MYEYLVCDGFQILGYADYAFTSIFTVEILLKVRKLHQYTPVYTSLHWYTPVYTGTHKDTQVITTKHHFISVNTYL